MLARMTDCPWWPAVGWTMIHFLWIGAVIGFVALAGRLLLRRCRPQIRYLFLTGCLLLMAVAPWPVLTHLLDHLPSVVAAKSGVSIDKSGAYLSTFFARNPEFSDSVATNFTQPQRFSSNVS